MDYYERAQISVEDTTWHRITINLWGLGFDWTLYLGDIGGGPAQRGGCLATFIVWKIGRYHNEEGHCDSKEGRHLAKQEIQELNGYEDISYFVSKCRIGCLDIIKHSQLQLVKQYIDSKRLCSIV
jgi:hypothetical protein